METREGLNSLCRMRSNTSAVSRFIFFLDAICIDGIRFEHLYFKISFLVARCMVGTSGDLQSSLCNVMILRHQDCWAGHEMQVMAIPTLYDAHLQAILSKATMITLKFYDTFFITRYIYTHSFGFFSTSTSLSSRLPFSGSCMYCHLAVSGKLIRMLSTLAPGVFNPNAVPLSCTRLNSTYLPRLNCCHCFISSVNGISLRLLMIGIYDGRNAPRQSCTNANNCS